MKSNALRESAAEMSETEIIERQKQEILRLGGMLSDATEAAARYQDALRVAEIRLKRVMEALTK